MSTNNLSNPIESTKAKLEKQIKELTEKANAIDKVFSQVNGNPVAKFQFDCTINEYCLDFSIYKGSLTTKTLKHCLKELEKVNKKLALSKALYK